MILDIQKWLNGWITLKWPFKKFVLPKFIHPQNSKEKKIISMYAKHSLLAFLTCSLEYLIHTIVLVSFFLYEFKHVDRIAFNNFMLITFSHFAKIWSVLKQRDGCKKR